MSTRENIRLIARTPLASMRNCSRVQGNQISSWTSSTGLNRSWCFYHALEIFITCFLPKPRCDLSHYKIHRGYSNVFVKYVFISRVKWTIFIFHE